eukprot:5136938-Pyramimonas_sp.AAC.1
MANRVWLTAGQRDRGQAWRDSCLGPWTGEAPFWPLLGDDALPEDLRPLAAERRGRLGDIT